MQNLACERFVRSHLKMKHLILLSELGLHASIATASKAANLTQPAASRLIANLEHVLGVQLLERSTRGVKPTWAGKLLIRRAGIVLAEMGAAHLEIFQLLEGFSGRVDIGSVLSPATGILSRAIRIFKTHCINTNLVIELGISKPMVERLLDGQLDIVLGRITDAQDVPALNFIPITDEEHQVIVRKGHPFDGRHDLCLSELMEMPWILPPAGSVFRERLTSRLLSQGVGLPKDTIETQDLPLILSLLETTDMLIALPPELVRANIEAADLVALPFSLDLQMGSYGIITRRGHIPSPSTEAMVLALEEALADERAMQRPTLRLLRRD
ncbi:transcriptional regulator, LysR family [Duganella sp. CF402]|uniref:LysR family transcriptional regulator n=1 Tax=unclassified Duganella TaxID=2636909 RepID=UPI0008C3EFAD|nr:MULTISPECIES: LysR family transcriptional regulator [unclassified Duganella]RZT08219.1 DNA-binding transcriptional LysR family regulator [Duganella sp. BK701]SEM01756.1 transcriptional regulator, LysR family [Duganella sp. CF402]